VTAATAAVAVADLAFSGGNSLAWVTVFVAETHIMLGAEPPVCHRHSVARARREIGVDGVEQVKVWVQQHRGWITAAGDLLAEMDEVERDPIPAIPREAEIAGSIAEFAAEGPLAEVIWAGFAARAQWLRRFMGCDATAARLISADPIAENAFQILSGERCTEIANRVHTQMPQISKEAERIAAR